MEASQRAGERPRELHAGRVGERRLARLDAGQEAGAVEEPRERLARPADVNRNGNRHRQQPPELRQHRELALGPGEDDRPPREAERPLLVDEVDGVVPALAEERHRPFRQRRELLRDEPARELLGHVLLGRPLHDLERYRRYAGAVARGAYLMQLGEVPYLEAWELQRSLAGAVSQGAIPDTVLLLEHPPVVTLGRRTDEAAELHVPAGAEVEVVETDRGGKSTFHGPGQLVCYPILDLKRHGRDVKQYVRHLEEALDPDGRAVRAGRRADRRA